MSDFEGALAFRMVALWLPESALLVGLIVFVHWKRPYFRRPGVRFRPELGNVRGAMMLLAIGVTLAPLRGLVDLVELLQGLMSSLGRGGLDFLVLLVCLALPVATLATSSYCAYLFYARKRSFPWLFVVSSTIFVLQFMIERWLGASELPAAPTPNDFVSLFMKVGWSIYALQSQRVKARFLPAPRRRSSGTSDASRLASDEA